MARKEGRLAHEELFVNGHVGGERLSKHERSTLRSQARELDARIEAAKKEDIAE
ncbi:hypothetical protein [Brevibacillus dissolubilis]|uniref:hypothetical protein n=1 Tax=Brevibacillus dissolubilis TaxID=1844116 RepID=UPI00159BA31A|nr:hypothetical protein [Brevibacillus dissolubilis]